MARYVVAVSGFVNEMNSLHCSRTRTAQSRAGSVENSIVAGYQDLTLAPMSCRHSG